VQRRRQRRARLLAGLAHPAAAAQNLGKPWPIVRGLLGEKRLPTTSLDRVIGNERTLAIVRSRLDALKTVAHEHGAKVNDVFLAGIAGGLRELLLHRGEPIAGLMMRVYVPLSLRLDQRAEARGNLISDMAVTVPVGISDPVTRLEQIAAETARLKARSHPSLGNVPHTGLAGRLVLMLFDRQRVNVVTADIPGPEFPLYLAGARILEVFPLVNLLWRQSLGIAGMSCAGQFNIMAVGDRETCPDIDVFAAGLSRELSALALSSRLAIAGR
jgi:hypothetical protein